MTIDHTTDLDTVDETPSPAPSRRHMLRLAGAAAVGAAAAAVAASSSTVSAANGDPLILGAGNNASNNTSLIGTMTVLAASNSTPEFVSGISASLVGWDTSNNAGLRAGVVGYSGPFIFGGGNTPHGVLGVVTAAAATGSAVYGRSTGGAVGASAGLRASSSNGPAVQLEAVAPGPPATGTWTQGALQPDTAGGLWYCTASGTPGTWVNLAAPQSLAGSFRAITPSRVYDSRSPQPSSGVITAGGTRTISIKDRRDLTSGVVATADIVPAGAQAITANVTVVNTTSAGFLAINPGGNTTVSAATVNWFATGQILNNGVNLTINPGTREVTVIAGGSTGATTDFVIDVTGYFL